MDRQKLRELIDELYLDLTFLYKGKCGIIMPENNDRLIIAYADDERICKNTDEVMDAQIFNGNSLNDICNEITEVQLV